MEKSPKTVFVCMVGSAFVGRGALVSELVKARRFDDAETAKTAGFDLIGPLLMDPAGAWPAAYVPQARVIRRQTTAAWVLE